MQPIISTVGKRLPLVGPVISGVGLALDVKEIVESSTPMGAVKIIGGRFVKKIFSWKKRTSRNNSQACYKNYTLFRILFQYIKHFFS